MNQDTAVKLDDVSESYQVDFILDGKIKHEELLVINKISLNVAKGECLAILGANGVGKTTLLKLIAGIIKPDSGQLRINGRVTCLLDLGAGLDPNATGRENIFILAELYGIAKKQIQHKLKQIMEFSGIGKFIDAPLKCYSAGMYVRLAFSLAINVEPDILLIDDCLVVGDENFQKKCIEKIFELKRSSKTIIFVTHDINLAVMIASRGIFLKDSRILYDGSIEKAFVYYTQMAGDMSGIGILDSGPASIIFNNGKLYLNWKDMPLSKGFGGYANMQMRGRQLFSKDMQWKIESRDARSLVASGQDISRSINQVWKIKLNDDGSIGWQINTESLAEIGFSLSRIGLMLNERFSKWATLADQGEFPPKYSSYGEWEVIESVKSNSNTGSLICAYDDEEPGNETALGVLLESDKDDYFRIPQAMISGLEQSSKIISLSAAEFDKQNAFCGKITVFDNKQTLESCLDYKKLKSVQERQIQTRSTRLFFDQGRLRLFYGSPELTKSNCFFSSFYSGQKWFNSSEATWDFRKQDANTLILKARWPGLKVSQIWQISLLNENEIIWKIGIEVKEAIEMLSFRNAVFLSEQYSDWFSTYEEGLFPDDYAWQDAVLTNDKRRAVGIKNKGDYPGLMLDLSEDLNLSLPAIQNTDLIHKSRVLYTVSLPSCTAPAATCREGYHDYFLAKLKIFPGAWEIEEYILANSKIKLEEELAEEASRRANLLQASTIQDGVTKIIFDSESMHIFYKESELTDSCGLRTIFEVADIRKELNSENARRKIDKVAKNRIICHFRWDDLSSVSQKWDVSIEDNTIHLLVTMSSFDKVDIYNQRTGIQISHNYKELKLAGSPVIEINYDFPGDFLGIPIKNNKSRIVFAQRHEEQGVVYPELLFKSLATDNPETISVTLDKMRGSGIFFMKIEDNPDADSSPGEYVYFKGSITLGCAAGEIDSSFYSARYELGSSATEPLGMSFDNGRTRIFWKGREITAGLGLYTSFCSNRQWYDSSQAFWKINHTGSASIEVTGSWPWIPVMQHWQIKRYKTGILLDINNQIYRELSLDAQEFNLLLIQEYRRWFAGEKSGCFYDEFSYDDLLRFRVWVSKTRNQKIGVKRMLFRLPAVSLISLNSNDKSCSVIENANILGEKGRLIQYLEIYRGSGSVIKPGKYNFFQGKIDLNKI